MGKFSNKPGGRPSKRKTLKQRYKIERKVKEFRKRTRRTARKLKATGAKKGGKREMALPNMFPFKTDVIDETKRERDYLTSLKKSKKQTNESQMQPENEITLANNKKQFTNVDTLIAKCDVVVEVLDVRNPMVCRNKEVEKSVEQQGKKLVLLLNKVDLVPWETALGWQKLLNPLHPTVLYRSLDSAPTQPKGAQEGTSAVGHGYLFHIARTLTQLEKVTIGVIGVAGVGRVAFLESLIRIGKNGSINHDKDQAQTIEITKNIAVLDAVGTVQVDPVPLVLRGKERGDRSEQLVEDILKVVEHDSLLELYRIPKFTGLQDFLTKIAKATGQLQKVN